MQRFGFSFLTTSNGTPSSRDLARPPTSSAHWSRRWLGCCWQRRSPLERRFTSPSTRRSGYARRSPSSSSCWPPSRASSTACGASSSWRRSCAATSSPSSREHRPDPDCRRSFSAGRPLARTSSRGRDPGDHDPADDHGRLARDSSRRTEYAARGHARPGRDEVGDHPESCFALRALAASPARRSLAWAARWARRWP